MAATASGDGPNGFSFDATLMMLSAGRPSSRATSSIGRPGWYTGRFFKFGLSGNGVGILQSVDDLFYVHVRGDQVANERNFFRVIRPCFDGEVVHLGGDLVTVRLGQQYGNGQ